MGPYDHMKKGSGGMKGGYGSGMKSMGGSYGKGHDPMVKRLSKHSIASKDSLYTKDVKHGQPKLGRG